MKISLTCPKCRGRKLWIVERLSAKDRQVSEGGGGADELRVAVARRTAATKPHSVWSGDGSVGYDAGYIDAYVCAACGYTELWSRGFETLVHNPADGVHFVDATVGRPR